jgi:phosphoserine phosphatase
VEKDRSFDLVAFDMDGVLVDYSSCWTWVHHHFGVDNEPALLSFVRGEIDDREFMRRDIALWRERDPKLDVDGLRCILEPLPFNEGIGETVAALREQGIKAVIVSGGLDIVAERIAQRYGFDDFIANGVESDRFGQLTGEGVLRVELLNKKLALEAFLAKYQVKKERRGQLHRYPDVRGLRHVHRLQSDGWESERPRHLRGAGSEPARGATVHLGRE